MMLLPLLLAASLAADTLTTRADGLSAQGVAVAVHRQPAVPLVSLRMALVASDPPGHAGAGHLVQHLVEGTLNEQAALVGARVQLERSSDAVVFTITGPSGELPYMAEILRGALRPAWTGGVTLVRAGRQLTEERLAEWETAERHARSALRLRLFPRELSAAGTERSAVRLTDLDAVRAAWEEMYDPARVSITAVGDVSMAAVSAVFGELPPVASPRRRTTVRDTASSEPLAPAEATHAWLGRGYLASDLDPAVLSVATRIATSHLRERLPSAGVAGEHWWTHHGQALVLIAYVPGVQQASAQRAMEGALSAASTGLTRREVAEAARALRRELLFNSRTPDRMAAILGEFADRTGEPDEAQRFYERLQRVTEQEVRDALATLASAGPTGVVDIAPQRLMRR